MFGLVRKKELDAVKKELDELKNELSNGGSMLISNIPNKLVELQRELNNIPEMNDIEDIESRLDDIEDDYVRDRDIDDIVADKVDNYMTYDFDIDNYDISLRDMAENVFDRVKDELGDEITQQIQNNTTDEKEVNKVFEIMGKAFIDFIDNANKLVEKYKLHKVDVSPDNNDK